MRRDYFDAPSSDFIRLNGGRIFIKKFEVNGLEWEKQYDEGVEVRPRLKVYLSDLVIYLYADDATSMMEAFELPPEPPWTLTSD